MSPTEAKKKIGNLRKQVAHHDELYYRQAQPEIADRDYDALKADLAALEKILKPLQERRETEGDGEGARR